MLLFRFYQEMFRFPTGHSISQPDREETELLADVTQYGETSFS